MYLRQVIGRGRRTHHPYDLVLNALPLSYSQVQHFFYYAEPFRSFSLGPLLSKELHVYISFKII